MKKLKSIPFLIILFTYCYGANAQADLYKTELPVNSQNKIELIEVIDFPDKSQQDLYLLAEEWIEQSYISDDYDIRLNKQNPEEITAKGIFSYTKNGLGAKNKYDYTLRVETKNKKARITLTNLNVKYTSMGLTESFPAEEVIIENLYKKNGKPKKRAKEQKEQILQFWNNTLASLTEKLSRDSLNDEIW